MKIIDKAYTLAKQVRLNAHAPYSKFLVGAVVKVKGSDQLFAACNVENASYGGAVCAERNAIFQMVAALGKAEPEFLVLVTDTLTGAAPCGFCLQVLSEFCAPDFPVH
ncbi:MAG: cytidine deaminase, partial [Bdellovibrionales bacterium]|nr:cytidine deaminase [Bdellovibrionales bacterium]